MEKENIDQSTIRHHMINKNTYVIYGALRDLFYLADLSGNAAFRRTSGACILKDHGVGQRSKHVLNKGVRN